MDAYGMGAWFFAGFAVGGFVIWMVELRNRGLDAAGTKWIREKWQDARNGAFAEIAERIGAHRPLNSPKPCNCLLCREYEWEPERTAPRYELAPPAPIVEDPPRHTGRSTIDLTMMDGASPLWLRGITTHHRLPLSAFELVDWAPDTLPRSFKLKKPLVLGTSTDVVIGGYLKKVLVRASWMPLQPIYMTMAVPKEIKKGDTIYLELRLDIDPAQADALDMMRSVVKALA